MTHWRSGPRSRETSQVMGVAETDPGTVVVLGTGPLSVELEGLLVADGKATSANAGFRAPDHSKACRAGARDNEPAIRPIMGTKAGGCRVAIGDDAGKAFESGANPV